MCEPMIDAYLKNRSVYRSGNHEIRNKNNANRNEIIRIDMLHAEIEARLKSKNLSLNVTIHI